MTPLQAASAILLSLCLPSQQQEIIRRGIKGMRIPPEKILCFTREARSFEFASMAPEQGRSL